jgi:hypothetical protein
MSPATHIKLHATVLIAFHHFSLLSSHLLLPSPFYCSMVDTTVHDFVAPVAPSVNDDDSRPDSGAESTVMAASSSPTYGATKMADGKNPRTH